MTSLTTTAILIDAHGSMIGRTREESRQALNEVTTRAIPPNSPTLSTLTNPCG